MFADLIVILFWVYLKCDYHVPTGFRAGKLRQNSNIQRTCVEVGVDVDVGIGLRLESGLSQAVGVGLALRWCLVGVFGVGLLLRRGLVKFGNDVT